MLDIDHSFLMRFKDLYASKQYFAYSLINCINENNGASEPAVMGEVPMIHWRKKVVHLIFLENLNKKENHKKECCSCGGMESK